jgi:tripartite-type tricarboxylate transporter receptor subunit TctC
MTDDPLWAERHQFLRVRSHPLRLIFGRHPRGEELASRLLGKFIVAVGTHELDGFLRTRAFVAQDLDLERELPGFGRSLKGRRTQARGDLMKLHATFAASLITAATLNAAARADPVSDFYKTHPVQLVVGYAVGGGFNIYARDVARYLGNHIPGHPDVIVQNMPGAGSVVASNWLYNVAPKDGSVIGMVRAPVMDPLTGTKRSMFDATKYVWLGNGMTEFTVCALLNNSSVETLADAQKYPFTMASLGPGSDEDMFERVLSSLFDLKAKIIAGYSGSGEAVLAIERGEVDGRCGWSWSSIRLTKPEWVNKLHVLAALSLARSPELPDAPSIMEFAKTDRQKQILKMVINGEALGRPFLAPPDIPGDRAAALRKAFADTMADPQFIADRRAENETVDFKAGTQVAETVKEINDTPKALVDETRKMIGSD